MKHNRTIHIAFQIFNATNIAFDWEEYVAMIEALFLLKNILPHYNDFEESDWNKEFDKSLNNEVAGSSIEEFTSRLQKFYNI